MSLKDDHIKSLILLFAINPENEIMKKQRKGMESIFPEGHPNRKPIDIYETDWDWNEMLTYINQWLEVIPTLLASCNPSTIKRTIRVFTNQDNIDLLSSRISYLVNKHLIISLYYKSLAPNYRTLLDYTDELSLDLLGVNNLIIRVHAKSKGKISTKKSISSFMKRTLCLPTPGRHFKPWDMR